MTVLYILDPGIVGGATKSFLSFVYLLRNRGIRPIVCTGYVNALSEELTSMGIENFAIEHQEMITECISLNIKTLFLQKGKIKEYIKKDIHAIRTIQRNVNMRDVDLIHTNSTRSDVGFFLSAMYKKPHVVHAREFGDNDYNCYPLNPLWKYYYNIFSDKFICVSNAVRNHWISKGIKAKKCITIYNGIEYEKIKESPDESKKDDVLKLVMSGSVHPAKGNHLAIKAIGTLPLEVKRNITLDFIGWETEDYKRRLIEISKNSEIVNPIRFLGARRNVLQMLGDYHVGLMCSKSEGFGRVTAEYMFAKLGVIASNSGASPELVEDGVCGLNFEVGNAESLAEKILYYYEHRDVLIQHSNAAREKAMRCFMAETNAENIYNIYMEILKK